MKPDMTWLVGLHVSNVEKRDHTWFFVLDDGSTIATESAWRLTRDAKIVVTSEDDGHQFGLPAPVDARARVKEAIGQASIIRFELRETTSDLVLHFPDAVAIDFLNLSCGYEGWRAVYNGRETVSLGGGEFAESKT